MSKNSGIIINGGGKLIAEVLATGNNAKAIKNVTSTLPSEADDNLASLQEVLTQWQQEITRKIEMLTDLEDDEKEYLLDMVSTVVQEATKSQDASPKKLERLIKLINVMSPDLLVTTASTFQIPILQQALGESQLLSETEEHIEQPDSDITFDRTSAIWSQINESFSDESLRCYCYDQPEFVQVYNSLNVNVPKAIVLDQVIRNAEQQSKTELLFDLTNQM